MPSLRVANFPARPQCSHAQIFLKWYYDENRIFLYRIHFRTQRSSLYDKKIAQQYKLNSFVTVVTCWVPDLPYTIDFSWPPFAFHLIFAMVPHMYDPASLLTC